jgi:hypothetical protein
MSASKVRNTKDGKLAWRHPARASRKRREDVLNSFLVPIPLEYRVSCYSNGNCAPDTLHNIIRAQSCR